MKTVTYHLEGMTCGSCEATVENALAALVQVDQAKADRTRSKVVLSGNNLPSLHQLQEVLPSKYAISKVQTTAPVIESTSWWRTYRPIILIFIYLCVVSTLVELISDDILLNRWMHHFMAGFFLVFSFFKLLNLKGFVESYRMYDIVARRFPSWGYAYAFIELLLGILYLIDFDPTITNSITLVVMSISIIGVLQTVLNKKRIQCACLGDVFNLPMSTVTIVEDGMMILMSAYMLGAAIL